MTEKQIEAVKKTFPYNESMTPAHGEMNNK